METTMALVMADHWERWGREAGLAVPPESVDCGYTRVKLVGPLAAWDAFAARIREYRETVRGPEKTSATRALTLIESNLRYVRAKGV